MLSNPNICTHCRELLASRHWTDQPSKAWEPYTELTNLSQFALKQTIPFGLEEEARLTSLISRGGLLYVSESVYKFILYVETYLRKNLHNFIAKPSFFQVLYQTLISDPKLPSISQCCNIEHLILKRSILIIAQRILDKLFNSHSLLPVQTN